MQPIFAYLPLRSYGFKFIIQADFEVPSSREDIDKDSAWNQCILHYIPELVAEAFVQFKVLNKIVIHQGGHWSWKSEKLRQNPQNILTQFFTVNNFKNLCYKVTV